MIRNIFDQKLRATTGGEESNQSWNLSGTSSPFKEVLNECRSGAEEDSMSTPNLSNMSFDSPIVVAKTPTGQPSVSSLAIETKKPEDSSSSNVTSTAPPAEPVGEDKKAVKKRDMFAPEADMFAEEYSVRDLFLIKFKTTIPFSSPVMNVALFEHVQHFRVN